MNKIRIKKVLFIFCLLVAVFAVAHFALAADLNVGLDKAAGTGLGDTDPRIIAARIIRIFLGFLGIIAVSLVMYAGWMYMTAEGDSEKVEKAKKILIGALIGLVICLASFAIASFILNSLLDASGANTNNNGGGGGGTVTPGGGIPNLPGDRQFYFK
jgi:amino acid transporter